MNRPVTTQQRLLPGMGPAPAPVPFDARRGVPRPRTQAPDLSTVTSLLPLLLPDAEKPAILALEVSRAWTPQVLGGLAPLVLAGGRALYCADGGNSFDPYAFSIHARQRGFDPALALDRVFLTRAFTIHQLEAVAEEMLPPLARAQPRPMVAVLGVEHLFLEETLPLDERRRVFARVLGHLGRLRDAGLLLLLTYDPPRRGGNEAPWWRPMIESASDAWGSVQTSGAPPGAMARRFGRGSPISC